MYCRKCGTDIPDFTKFCRVCGQARRTTKRDSYWPHPRPISKASLPQGTAHLPSWPIQTGYEGDFSNWKYWGAGISGVILVLAGIWFAIGYEGDSDNSDGDTYTDYDDIVAPTGNATVHIQFTSWYTENQGQDSGSLPRIRFSQRKPVIPSTLVLHRSGVR